MNRCCFVIPYYGDLPSTFPVFLKSCGENPDFDWLLLTNDRRRFDYPSNVRVIYNTLQDLRDKAEQVLGFAPTLDRAYRICDMRPAFGLLYEDLLAGYEFWGHCDIDTVMGRLSHFLTPELLEQYDKLFCAGHLQLYRNTPELNRLFMSEHHGRLVYKDAMTGPKNAWFDELYQDDNNGPGIFIAQGKRVYTEDLSLNIWIGSRKFRWTWLVGFDRGDEHGYLTEDYHPAAYYWDHGRILRLSVENGSAKTEEFLYMHLQYREMEFSQKILESDVIRIVPNRFLPAQAVPAGALQICLASFVPPDLKRAVRAARRLLGSRS